MHFDPTRISQSLTLQHSSQTSAHLRDKENTSAFPVQFCKTRNMHTKCVKLYSACIRWTAVEIKNSHPQRLVKHVMLSHQMQSPWAKLSPGTLLLSFAITFRRFGQTHGYEPSMILIFIPKYLHYSPYLGSTPGGKSVLETCCVDVFLVSTVVVPAKN